MKLHNNLLILLLFFCTRFSAIYGQIPSDIIGKWDLTVQMDSLELSSWLEV